MASRLLVAVALFAACQSSPVEELRGKRSFTSAIGSSIGYAGKNTASAVVAGDKADAQAYNENGALAQDAHGNNLPGQAFAKVGSSDNAGEAVYRGYAQPAYYPIPAPATVLTYQKYAAPEIPSQIVYEAPAPSHAQSSAVINSGYGSVNSDANSGFGSAASNANAQGSGPSAVSSLAQSNGPISEEPVVIAAKGIHSVYTPVGHNSASSNANANGYHSSANSAARVGAVPTRKSISWRFGTAYDQPAAYGAAKSSAANFGHGSAAARSDISGQGSLSSAANTYGSGSAQSAAANNGFGSSVKSATNSFGGGSGSAIANINPNYAALRSENIPAGYGALRSTAASQNGGSSISRASTDSAGNEYVDTAARSNIGGTAHSAAVNSGSYGLRSNGAWGGRIGSNSYTSGQGNAVSSARSQGVSTGYRVVNANANSDAAGSAHSNAYSL